MSYKTITKKQALKLLRKNNPENIVKHCLKVSFIARKIALKLKKQGTKIDVKLTELSGLLHDLDKFKSLSNGYDYNKEILRLYKKGYRKIAKTVMNAQLDEFLNKPLNKHSIEEIVVQYADKRVLHDKVVSLNKRFNYLYKRYGKNSRKVLMKLRKAKLKLEKIQEFLGNKAKFKLDTEKFF